MVAHMVTGETRRSDLETDKEIKKCEGSVGFKMVKQDLTIVNHTQPYLTIVHRSKTVGNGDFNQQGRGFKSPKWGCSNICSMGFNVFGQSRVWFNSQKQELKRSKKISKPRDLTNDGWKWGLSQNEGYLNWPLRKKRERIRIAKHCNFRGMMINHGMQRSRFLDDPFRRPRNG